MADENCPSLLGTLDFLKFPDIPNLDINQSIQPKIDDINNQLSSMSDFSSQGTLVVPSELSENQSNTDVSSKFSDSNSKEVSIDESSSSDLSKSGSEPESEDVFYTPASSESELSSMSDASENTSKDASEDDASEDDTSEDKSENTSVKQSGGKKKKKW